jgi:hypothetical protein
MAAIPADKSKLNPGLLQRLHDLPSGPSRAIHNPNRAEILQIDSELLNDLLHLVLNTHKACLGVTILPNKVI